MFERVTIRVADLESSARFYSTVLSALGIERTPAVERTPEWGEFSLAAADDDHPDTQRLHIGFASPSRGRVDQFWHAGTEAGYRDDGAPGPRPQYRPEYYGGFLLDPDGNSAEAVHHADTADREVIDHLWLRVADVGAAREFYESLAPRAGFEVRIRAAELVQCVGEDGSFSLVAGERPTENVHLAFPTTDRAANLVDPDGNEIELTRATP
jgi:catechol 2,3-dioxygenase-like lactoylglutathione lyase family enzyme